jgi:uncharacterized membrane protein
MRSNAIRWPAALSLAASLLGLALSWSSTQDYAKHLDRQVHDVHCSFVPGAAAEAVDNACRTAMYSPYAALFRDRYWGGVPIALFAVGAFSFFAAFAVYTLFAGADAPRRVHQFSFAASLAPTAASVTMLVISAVKLGTYCKTCVGIYVASGLLLVAGVASLVLDLRENKRERAERDLWERSGSAAKANARVEPTLPDLDGPTVKEERPLGARVGQGHRPSGHWAFILLWLAGLGASALLPPALYVGSLPSYADKIASCGKLEELREPTGALLQVTPKGATQPAVLFVDPLCPTCKALHQRLRAEGFWDQLDTTLVLFPLDNTCNWMLDRPLHPGSCVVAKAVLCSPRALEVLEWAYERQDELLASAKAGAGVVNVRSQISSRWPGLDACIDSKETAQRLDKHLRFIVKNKLPVQTPQIFLGDKKLCDEDSDMGLAYALPRLAPGVKVR